jgi:nucleoid-associated protein YgaU
MTAAETAATLTSPRVSAAASDEDLRPGYFAGRGLGMDQFRNRIPHGPAPSEHGKAADGRYFDAPGDPYQCQMCRRA